MKYAVILTSDTGKQVKLAGSVFIEIDAMHGNKRIARIVLRDGDLIPDIDLRAPRASCRNSKDPNDHDFDRYGKCVQCGVLSDETDEQ